MLNGAFDGAVVGTISSDFLSRLVRQRSAACRQLDQLTHDDGTVLLRIPLRDVDIDPQSVASKEVLAAKARGGGEYVKTSPFDGIERLFSLRRIGKLPIYVTVGCPPGSSSRIGFGVRS